MTGSDKRAAALSVVHVLDTEGYAGRESVVERLASAQLALGSDVRVAAVIEQECGTPPFIDAAREAGLSLHVLRLPPRAYLSERSRLIDLFQAHDADVMHSHGYRPDVVGGSAARKAGVARVSTVHGFIGGGWKNRCYEWLQQFSLRRFDRIVAVSTEMAREVIERGVPAEKVRVVRNALGQANELLSKRQARRELGVDRARFLIGWVGRISQEKGLDVLINGLRRHPVGGVSLSVIGEGPEREHLMREAEGLPPDVDVRWHGRIESASRLFRAFDAFVLSSRSEGTPMVLLEAMAAEVPVIATAVGGVPDVVSANEAWLIPPESPEALSDAVAEVRSNPEEASARAAAARERLEEEFGREEWVADYADVYREAIRSQRKNS